MGAGNEQKIHNKEVIDATVRLETEVIPRFAAFLDERYVLLGKLSYIMLSALCVQISVLGGSQAADSSLPPFAITAVSQRLRSPSFRCVLSMPSPLS